MEITRIHQGPITILAIQGPIVTGELDPLDAQIEECIQTGSLKIVLDIAKVPFIDSNGLDKILDISLYMGKQGGDARIAAPNDVCGDIFRATGVDSMVQIFDDRDSVIKSLL